MKPKAKQRTMVTHRFQASTLPVRETLVWKPAIDHLVVASGAGIAVVERLLQTPPKGIVEVIILAPDGKEPVDYASICRDQQGVEALLAERLASVPMGAELYAAGPEAFLTLVQRVACAADFPTDAIMTERAGSAARDCQCAHCKGIKRGQETRFYICPHCGEALLVRDHFSPRLGLYQAVAISPNDERISVYKDTVLT